MRQTRVAVIHAILSRRLLSSASSRALSVSSLDLVSTSSRRTLSISEASVAANPSGNRIASGGISEAILFPDGLAATEASEIDNVRRELVETRSRLETDN